MLQELRFCLPDAPHLLHSCAADGTVRGWDARVGQQVERCDGATRTGADSVAGSLLQLFVMG